MRREERLTRPKQYTAVYRNGRSRMSNLLVMRALPNGLAISRYGLSASKRVGKAVTRNRIRRLLREILPVVPVKSGWDIVFIVRPAAAGADYATLKKVVVSLLAWDGLIDGEVLSGSFTTNGRQNVSEG